MTQKQKAHAIAENFFEKQWTPTPSSLDESKHQIYRESTDFHIDLISVAEVQQVIAYAGLTREKLVARDNRGQPYCTHQTKTCHCSIKPSKENPRVYIGNLEICFRKSAYARNKMDGYSQCLGRL